MVLSVQFLEQIRVVGISLALGVEPVTEHLDGAVDGDVLSDGKGPHGGGSIQIAFTALLCWQLRLLC